MRVDYIYCQGHGERHTCLRRGSMRKPRLYNGGYLRGVRGAVSYTKNCEFELDLRFFEKHLIK